MPGKRRRGRRLEHKEKSLENPTIIWRAGDTKTDTHHINSIIKKNGEILVSAFGPKTGQLWSTASNGYIYNISTNSLMVDGIYHPHSLSVRKGNIFYSDSQRNTFCAIGQKDPIFHLNGYTRGSAWLSDDMVCLATSIGRRVSKSTGLISNPADPGEPAGECDLLLGSISKKKIISNIDVSWYGPEIYDVLELETNRIDLLSLSNTAQMAERQVLQVLSAQVAEKEQSVQALTAQVAEKEQSVQALTAQVAEKEQSVQALTAQVAEKEQSVQALTAQVAEKEQIIAEQNRELLEIITEQNRELSEIIENFRKQKN